MMAGSSPAMATGSSPVAGTEGRADARNRMMAGSSPAMTLEGQADAWNHT